MSASAGTKYYTPVEEFVNISSHAIGLLLSVIATGFLIAHAGQNGGVWHIVSFAIFGSSLIILYAASTSYHSAKDPMLRRKLRVIDHAAIYVLIAGSYTPFTLVTLNGSTGWMIFAASWAMAITGVVLKIFFTGRYNLISTAMYVFMGWMIMFAIKPLAANLPAGGIYWLAAGGVAYTLGAVIYSIKRVKFNHAIFHVFVLIGSASHFVAVYFYVLPGAFNWAGT